MQGLVALKRQHGFLLLVDEAHATLVCGENGGGGCQAAGVSDEVRPTPLALLPCCCAWPAACLSACLPGSAGTRWPCMPIVGRPSLAARAVH